ncbi:hypothetical protein [Heyndrickxia oleronia]|jgi:hypothetical protein|uniref:Uncharacterized protein n=1 Tax=Heyndrickxia oleronia TaxID=38875 RepID=A0A8E2I5X6_9BACI|nr:hypothetical protein [Heyndrickxia oleronia]OJH18417.1 hypothetical protein BLX88_12680 [Bacillus obstructivus]MCI1590235.1 hypothetical protein [Heyndrickxia oleronia]MCI1614017.1 hypothetical protein [Heyndrickxia oleronia]MCI1744331.1 hypothetical protein [Heyndrickxia oleronia]MCI1761879.1 hypothetical protein [Heyndrickxia oleronia]
MSHLGKYEQMPLTFEKLKKLEVVLEKEGYSLDEDLGLILQSDYYSYSVTPYDVITFASIGCDGIHFGLLTDFGTVSDLENAFVVCISPMDFGSHIKIVARNIREFVSLICTMKDTGAISNFNHMKEEEEYLNLLKQIKKEEPENKEFVERANYVVEKIISTIRCEIIDDVYQYVERMIRTERKQQTILPTLDGLGVVAMENVFRSHSIYKLEEDMNINLNEVKNFFNTASTESKLAFIRDAQFTNLISDEIELKELVINEMIKLGLNDEVGRLKNIDD